MSLDNHLMFEAFGTFRPVENYADNGYHFTFNYGRDQKAYVGIFITLILAENRLRATVQRGEYVSTKIRELSGFNTIRAVKFNFKKKLLVSSRLEKLTKELHDLQKERWIQTQELFTAEAMLPAKPLKELYDSLREDPKWYLREELVEDCKGRGGCCARECGCCEKRQATPGYTKGIGHCSVTCGCCIETRGFELTEQEEDMFHDNLHDMLWDENPAYLLKMTEAFFSKPESKPKINANENPESQSVGTRPPSYSE